MTRNSIGRYEEVSIMTASPGDILISLLDGLFKFLNVARLCMRNGDRERAGNAILKAHAVISELMLSLDDKHVPGLCERLRGVYDFCLFRLTCANRQNDAKPIDEVVRVLTPIREGFSEAVQPVACRTLKSTRSRE